MKKVRISLFVIASMVVSIVVPSRARLLMSKNRKFFVSASPNAILTSVLIRHEADQYAKATKKVKQSLKTIPEGLNWVLTEDDLP
jgi:hypothetical protein